MVSMLMPFLKDAAPYLGPAGSQLLSWARELSVQRKPAPFLLEDILREARAAVAWGEVLLSLQLHPDLEGAWEGDATAWRLLLEQTLSAAVEGNLGPQLNGTFQPGDEGRVARLTLWPTLPNPDTLTLVGISHVASHHGGNVFLSGTTLNLALPLVRALGYVPPAPEPVVVEEVKPQPTPEPERPVVAAPPLSDVAGVRQQILQHFEADELEAARALLTEVHPRLPDPESGLLLAEDCVQWGEIRLAEAFYDSAADGFLERGDLRAGVEALQRMQILKPEDLPLRQMIGTLWLKQEDYAQANAAFRSILRTRPSHRGALAGLAQIAELTGDEGLAELVRRRLQQPASHF